MVSEVDSFVKEFSSANKILHRQVQEISEIVRPIIPDCSGFLKGIVESQKIVSEILSQNYLNLDGLIGSVLPQIDLKGLTESLKIIADQKEFFLLSLEPLASIGIQWNNLAKGFLKSLAFIDEEEFSDFEYNWVGFLTIEESKELYEKFKSGKISEVRDFFSSMFSTEEKTAVILSNFSRNPLFSGRIGLLRDAFEAHRAGKYSLSIPLFLSQIDGIFIEKHSDLDGKIKFSQYCPHCEKTYEAPSRLTAGNISRYLQKRESDYLEYYLKHITSTFEGIRNNILHGKRVDYPSKDLSTKLIVTLIELSKSSVSV